MNTMYGEELISSMHKLIYLEVSKQTLFASKWDTQELFQGVLLPGVLLATPLIHTSKFIYYVSH